MKRTILTVEDSVSMRQLVSFTLREAGHEVVEAEDGVDALERLRERKVDMIITDLNMPNLDGISLIRKVREGGAHRCTPILMLTTESQEARRLEGKAAGATGWIVKPFRGEQLLTVIRKVLG